MRGSRSSLPNREGQISTQPISTRRTPTQNVPARKILAQHAPGQPLTELASVAPLATYRVTQARPHHGPGIHEVICLANGYPVGTRGCARPDEVARMLEHFPGGHFVVVTGPADAERVVGVALAMRTDYPPSAHPLSWWEMIGDLTLPNHDPNGRWLYGVDKAVHPDFQGRGIASALYKAQFALVKRLGLEGMYAGGMLKGYGGYRTRMSVREYASKVVSGELFDPTVSVQMKRGFKPYSVIENYAWDRLSEHTGMLIVWHAQELRAGRRRAASKDAERPARLRAGERS